MSDEFQTTQGTGTVTGSGMLTSRSILEALDMIRVTDHTEPLHFFLSPFMRDRLIHMERIGKMYRAHPLPKRRIRKCHMRKLWTVRKQGRTRIERIERREALSASALLPTFEQSEV